MGWHATLHLDYHLQGERTVAHDRHEGPLRVLQRLYPEGPQVCHHVLVHPPGGIAGGDHLEITAQLGPRSHALITTPGATRFYRSEGAQAVQHARVHLERHARLEWLPLETLAYDGCQARNRLEVHLQPQSAMMGWDVLALGLPAADVPFSRGSFWQDLRVHHAGHTWLERGQVAAQDTRLLDAPLGWDGHRVLGVMWMAWADATDATDATDTRSSIMGPRLLEAARAQCHRSELRSHLGVTQPWSGPLQVVLLRALAPRVEPLMQVLMQVRAHWRQLAWSLEAAPPRVWRT